MKLKLLLGLLLSFSVFNTHSQYCTSGGPSSGIDSNLESASITGESGSSISYTGCPGVIGVEEVLSQNVILNAGGNYTLNLQFGTCGGNYGGVGEAWIDYNGDGTFSTNESLGTWQGTPPTAPSSFNFSVPSTAVNGVTRMRVIQYEGGGLPISSCASFTWGSVVDFSVTIQNGIDCSSIIGDDTTNPITVNTYPYSDNNNSSACYSNMNPVYDSPDVFYLLTNFSGLNSLEISLCGSTFDTYLTVILPNGTVVANNDDHQDCGSQSKVIMQTYNYDSLFVIVEGWGNNQGNYTLTINEGTLGLNNLSIQHQYIYPNPAKDFIQISNNFSGEYEILNMNGEIVTSGFIYTNQKIDINNLVKGIYYVKCYSNDNHSTHKLIII